MKKGNRIVLGITAALAALGIGIIVGGTLVATPGSTPNATVQEEVVEKVPAVPANALASKRVLVIATPAANRITMSKVQQRIGRAAGVVSGVITLTPKFSETNADLELGTLITETLPAGIKLPTDRDQNAGRLTGVVLSGLVHKPSNPAGDTVRSEFLDRMVRAGFFAQDSYYGAADVAVLITGSDANGKIPASESGKKAITLAKLAKGLAERDTRTVVAGPGNCFDYPGPVSIAQEQKIDELRVVQRVNQEAGQAKVILQLAGTTR